MPGAEIGARKHARRGRDGIYDRIARAAHHQDGG